MENPKDETPIAIEQQPPIEPAVEEKRPFFTVGKILAIFGVLLIIGTVVGAVMYSRSSERFKGDVTDITGAAPTTTCDKDKNWVQTMDATGAPSCVCIDGYVASSPTDICVEIDYCKTNQDTLDGYLSSNYVSAVTKAKIKSIIDNFDEYMAETCVEKTEEPVESGTIPTEPVCDSALNRTLSKSDITLAAYVAPVCVCNEGLVSLVSYDKCVEVDYCSLTEEQLSAYLNSPYVTDATKKIITTEIGVNLPKYKEINCEEETLTGITTLREPLNTLTFPSCTLPLVETNYTGVDGNISTYCMCPIQKYPFITLSGGLAAAPVTITECRPFSCDLTAEQEAKMYQDLNATLTKQELDDSVIADITTKFKSDYKAYADKCPPEEVVTCDDLKADLGTAYYAGNWDEYNSVLRQMQEQKCIDSCELLFYRAVLYLSQNQIAEARKMIDEYLNTCTDECTLTYGILSLYAEKLSELEQQAPTLSSFNAPSVTTEDLARLKELVIRYIEKCQCFEIESFLTAPGFPEEDYFVQGASVTLNTSRVLDSTDRIDFSKLSSGNSIRTAYAQSLSSSVRGVIEDVYNDLCVPDEEPKVCTKLMITAPSATGTYNMSRDFNPATDYLEFTVDNDDLIEDYKINSSTIIFDGSGKNITTDKTKVSMSGGPAQGIEDVINVMAVDQSGAVVKDCSATLTVKRPMDPPVEQDPVCRSLEIISPMDAAEPGVPTIELASGIYANKDLEIKVSADDGSVKDYKYASANEYIKFNNGENPLYTTNKTVVMNGVIPEGETDTISVWARDPNSEGIQDCHDGYVITVPKEETPPPVEKTPPPVTTTEEPPPPPIKETIIPLTPTTPVVVTTPVHSAAPEAPQTGPGVLIYLVGASLGGALLRRKN